MIGATTVCLAIMHYLPREKFQKGYLGMSIYFYWLLALIYLIVQLQAPSVPCVLVIIYTANKYNSVLHVQTTFPNKKKIKQLRRLIDPKTIIVLLSMSSLKLTCC